MRFTKPAWVIHKDSAPKNDQTTKRLSIFSVHVHPDGSRIATGGLDAKIRIWSTRPILQQASELSNKPPKSLCTLTMHTGPVLTVRWAHSGKWLASGSDDEIVMVWDLDPTARGKVWGSDEVNVEGWKPLKRLPGHESDVTDVAWSPGDRYLASVGLDSKVIVWCGFTLERLHKLEQHQGFVKGVCWDPVGEFLATQSDDRSVKIWRTIDWKLEAEVRKPFEDSPGSTFFRRLSWSPDGAHITASNATNNKGLVFIAAVITRNSWTSDISLVGHENTVEVAAYNPHIFLRNPSSPVATSNICSVVALGADDRSVSVWQTKSARPLIVAREVFDRQIMDLSWSWDGLTLYAASSDGTIGVFNFDLEELEGIAPSSIQEQYLRKFDFQPPPLPEGYSHHSRDPRTSPSRTTPPPSPSQQVMHLQSQTGFGPTANPGGERVNKLVAKRSNKKRIHPTLVSSVPSAATHNKPSHAASNGIHSRPLLLSDASRPSSHSQSPIIQNQPYFAGPESRGFERTEFGGDVDIKFGMDVDMDVPISSLDTSSSVAKGKRKAPPVDLTDDASARPGKARTLGGDRLREVVPVKEISGGGLAGVGRQSWGDVEPAGGGVALPLLPILTCVSVKMEGSEDVFEARNSENDGPTEVMFVVGKQTQWLDYLPSPVLSVAVTTCFCAVAMHDGSVSVYSHTGRRLMSTLSLGSPCAIMDGSKTALMVLTSSGQLYCWNVKKQVSVFPPTSILPLLTPSLSPNHACTILSATVRPNGVPVIQLSSGIAHSYSPALSAWIKVSERWWAEGSDVWQGRQRSSNSSNNHSVLSSIESTISAVVAESVGADAADKTTRPQWWNTALTLGHLETRMLSARALDSPGEYKQALLLYAKKIADEGFRGKAEELIKELFGPVYWRPGREDGWSPTLMGLTKRDLLKDVLLIFVRSRTLTKLALDWQDTSKKAANDD